MNKIDRYKELVDIDPSDVDSWMNLGDVYYDETNYPKAIECYEKVVELYPYSSEEAWNNLGLSHSCEGNYHKAIESYKKSLELDPDDAIARININ